MTDRIVSFEVAELAQGKGCRETAQLGELLYVYNDNKNLCKEYSYVPDYDAIEYPDIIAPTQSLLQKWLRENHNLHIIISPILEHTDITGFFMEVQGSVFYDNSDTFSIYEDALEKGLKVALKSIT